MRYSAPSTLESSSSFLDSFRPHQMKEKEGPVEERKKRGGGGGQGPPVKQARVMATTSRSRTTAVPAEKGGAV